MTGAKDDLEVASEGGRWQAVLVVAAVLEVHPTSKKKLSFSLLHFAVWDPTFRQGPGLIIVGMNPVLNRITI